MWIDPQRLDRDVPRRIEQRFVVEVIQQDTIGDPFRRSEVPAPRRRQRDDDGPEEEKGA